ncbi:MAG: hypothetical protein MPJ24_09915 [Pirellulaceae bacterium]|nr:hypothetical protein [Pirellulaceae bacterium]
MSISHCQWTDSIRGRRGLTLTEILVTTTLTMIILGIVVGIINQMQTTINQGQSAIQLSKKMVEITSELQEQLDNVTVPVTPYRSIAEGGGYFEYIEGDRYDGSDNQNNLAQSPIRETFVQRGTTTGLRTENVWGDIDDVLSYTAYNPENPFTGIFNGRTISSPYAEIIWYTVFDDKNGNGQTDLGDLKLYRRVLLIRPDLNLPDTNGRLVLHLADEVTPYELGFPSTTPADIETLHQNLQNFYHRNDISVRVSPDPNNSDALNLVANSLDNLTLRENRVGHQIKYFNPNQPNWPYLLSSAAVATNQLPAPLPSPSTVVYNANSVGVVDGVGAAMLSPILAPKIQIDSTDPTIDPADYPPILDDNGNTIPSGGDLVSDAILAFDVKVFDPMAPIFDPTDDPANISSTINTQLTNETSSGIHREHQTAHVLSPGDTGFTADLFSANPGNLPLPRGDYVDLGYLKNSTYPDASYFSDWSRYSYDPTTYGTSDPAIPPTPSLSPPWPYSIYDTWCSEYNRGAASYDGIDSRGIDGSLPNGQIDDFVEQLTVPPYSHPIRGLSVTIRIFSKTNQKIGETTVITSFSPE